MAKINKPQHLSLWRLINLGQELEDIAVRLALLAKHFKRGLAEHQNYEDEQRRSKRRVH